MKKTPPGFPLHSKAGGKNEGRLTWGYPCITAIALNTAQPALLYHRLFSYVTADFDSQPLLAMRHLRKLLPGRKITIVSDAEGDDQKLWAEAAALDLEWITRATSKRIVEVYRPRQGDWQEKELQSWSQSRPGRAKGNAGRTIPVRVTLDWFRFRLPDRSVQGWVVVARTAPIGPHLLWLDETPLVLVVINRPVRRAKDAWQVYRDWAQRGKIEPFYRFQQEDGLDVEVILMHPADAACGPDGSLPGHPTGTLVVPGGEFARLAAARSGRRWTARGVTCSFGGCSGFWTGWPCWS